MLKTEIPRRTHTGEFRITNSTNKKYLAQDFKHRCAYCDDIDYLAGGYKSYHVEHFAPKEKFPELEFMYENLLYACPYCNCSKNDDWPGNNAEQNIVGNTGYIDPCKVEYYSHLDRNLDNGKIYYKTELGRYMYDHLKLYLLRHSLIYMIDKLKMKREELNNSIEKDKIAGIDVSKKEKILLAIDSEFFYYFSKWQQDQEQIT